LLWSVVGWTGAALYLGAYLYLAGSVAPQVRVYYATNLLAALLVCLSSVDFGTWPTVVINGFWAGVSSVALRGRDVAPGFLRAPVLNSLLTTLLATSCAVAVVLWLHAGAPAAASLLGWSSAAAFCFGYLLFAAEGIERRAFLAYNLYAALVLLPRLILDSNWPVVGLEVVWALVSLGGLATSRWQGEPVEPERMVSARSRPRTG
jgi:hypothetical protein